MPFAVGLWLLRRDLMLNRACPRAIFAHPKLSMWGRPSKLVHFRRPQRRGATIPTPILIGGGKVARVGKPIPKRCHGGSGGKTVRIELLREGDQFGDLSHPRLRLGVQPKLVVKDR